LEYASLKLIHIGLAGVSLAGFVLRWVWMMRDSALVKRRLTRTLPHVMDTLFLASGIALAWRLQLNPFTTPWLAAKLCGLVLYVLFASIAYKRVDTTRFRTLFFGLALSAFAWVVMAAITKSPFGML